MVRHGMALEHHCTIFTDTTGNQAVDFPLSCLCTLGVVIANLCVMCVCVSVAKKSQRRTSHCCLQQTPFAPLGSLVCNSDHCVFVVPVRVAFLCDTFSDICVCIHIVMYNARRTHNRKNRVLLLCYFVSDCTNCQRTTISTHNIFARRFTAVGVGWTTAGPKLCARTTQRTCCVPNASNEWSGSAMDDADVRDPPTTCIVARIAFSFNVNLVLLVCFNEI